MHITTKIRVFYMYGAKVWPHLAQIADLDLGSIARASRFQRRARYRPAAARKFSPSATARRRVSVRSHYRLQPRSGDENGEESVDAR